MELFEIMQELESLGTERTKKYYQSQGAREPLFGVATGAMKPLLKKLKNNQAMAEALYETGNFDAMYLAGMIADPKLMTPSDFHRWMEKAYFYMISDFIVAVTLAETDVAQEVADQFIASGEDLVMSGGWSCYEWLLGSRKDTEFDSSKLLELLNRVEQTIHSQPNDTKNAMNRFVIALGVSYLPLHQEALDAAERIGEVMVAARKGTCALPSAAASIKSQAEKGRLGFKRKNVRC